MADIPQHRKRLYNNIDAARAEGMNLRLTGSISGIMEQRLVMTPPIANSIDDVVTRPKEARNLDEKIVKAIGDYIRTEYSTKPYTDADVLNYMKDQCYETLTRKDVALARKELNIPTASNRYKVDN